MADLVINPVGVQPFDLNQHIQDDRFSNVPHVSEDGSTTTGAYSALLFEKQQPYRSPDNTFHEYPKCVTFGKFSGVAKNADHEAELKSKHSPVAPPPQGQGGQGSQASRPQAPQAPQPPRN